MRQPGPRAVCVRSSIASFRRAQGILLIKNCSSNFSRLHQQAAIDRRPALPCQAPCPTETSCLTKSAWLFFITCPSTIGKRAAFNLKPQALRHALPLASLSLLARPLQLLNTSSGVDPEAVARSPRSTSSTVQLQPAARSKLPICLAYCASTTILPSFWVWMKPSMACRG